MDNIDAFGEEEKKGRHIDIDESDYPSEQQPDVDIRVMSNM